MTTDALLPTGAALCIGKGPRNLAGSGDRSMFSRCCDLFLAGKRLAPSLYRHGSAILGAGASCVPGPGGRRVGPLPPVVARPGGGRLGGGDRRVDRAAAPRRLD